MEIVIAEQGAFCLEPPISADEARGRATAQRTAAFGTLSRLLSRPKPDDISVEEQGLCYVPYWHAKAHVRFVYDRRELYSVPTKTRYTIGATIGGNDYAVSEAGSLVIELPAIEHCERDELKELWLDAVLNQPMNAQPYAKANASPISLETFAPENAKIVTPTVRASAVVRALLGEDLWPTDADEVKEERVNVDCIDLYFRPEYRFKYNWTAKNKSAEVAVDGVTGELKAEPSGAGVALGKLLQREALFDIGAETLNLVVPGGGIALRVAKAMSERAHSG
jgi:hypothetical protein